MEEEITKIKIENATMAEKLDNLCNKVDNLDDKLSDYIKYEKSREAEMKNNFAGKWVEAVAMGALLAGIAAIIKVVIESI